VSLPKPDGWWRDLDYREALRQLGDPEYFLARLERDRAIYAAAGGWTWTTEPAIATVTYLREATESARRPFEEIEDSGVSMFLRRRKRLKIVTAFWTAMMAELKEYEGMIADSFLGPGGNPDNEREMQRLLERYERRAKH
jgi:hypothetical protein